MVKPITVGAANGEPVNFSLKYANRHGLIAGATGTGKTVSVQVLAEAFSRAGVPVFLADVKGDIAGLGAAGKPHKKIDERLAKIPLPEFTFEASPIRLWDMHGKHGIPLRLALSDLGPSLLSAMLDLNDTQAGILASLYEFADDEGLLLTDLNDLRTGLDFLRQHGKDNGSQYAQISPSSIAAIRRRLTTLTQEGLSDFFGEPSVEFPDLIRSDGDRGVINVLDARKLMQTPKTYAIFLLWLMAELFEHLPELGDPEKPVFVLFFDEAHLLFKDCPKPLLNKIEQVVRLIRSKGVGLYFISQSPSDIPDSVLSQLGNRIQHALRAYTPKERKAVRTAVQSFRPNPAFDIETLISELGVGEALVSTLANKGVPTIVQHTLMSPPRSRIGPLTKKERSECLTADTLMPKYRDPVDPKSAHEVLQARTERIEKSQTKTKTSKKKTTKRRGRSRQGVGEAFVKSIARSLGGSLGRRLVRGVLGSLLK